MVNINISIKEEAYRFLSALKGNGKSFSDVILEFRKEGKPKKGSKEAIMKYYGGLKDEDVEWEDKKKRMVVFRESFRRRLKQNEIYKGD